MLNSKQIVRVLRYNAVFSPEPEGGFTVVVPSLPGCVTYGKDLNEAKIMALNAISGYIKSLKKHNLRLDFFDSL